MFESNENRLKCVNDTWWYTVTYWQERTYLIYDVRGAFLIIKLLLSMPTRTAGTARDEYILLHGQIVGIQRGVWDIRHVRNSRRWRHSTTRITIMKADRSQLARNNVELTDEITMTILCFYNEEIFAIYVIGRVSQRCWRVR